MAGVLQRTLAGVLSATILFLTVLAVSPAAHEGFHSNAADANHTCAITLFAQGITSPVCHFELPLPLECLDAVAPVAGEELRLVSPRYLLKPLRGPPIS